MRVLVIGNGGREHAICWKLRQSPLLREIYCAPGNAGIASVADRVPIGTSDIVELADFAQNLRMDLTIVGSELPLTLGIVDEFNKRGLPVFGPTRLAAELEGSKAFSKDFMRRYGIPTAEATVCSSLSEAEAAIGKSALPLVIKVDGLASGKGVFIHRTAEEALGTVRDIYLHRKFGNAADRVLIEEYLEGEEVSFMALTDGRRVVPFAPAKDYKKAFEDDLGPNTGGMGSHSPAVVMSTEVAAEVMKTIVIPSVQGMEKEGRLYSGCLFVGLMLTAAGPKVLEYNCRFGDPETQVQLLRLEDDLAELCLDVARGNLGERRLVWKKEAAACVVVTAREYPGEVVRGLEVTLDPVDDPSIVLFHSGTEMKDGKLVNIAGRVVSACAHAPTLTEALSKAYAAAAGVRFEGARFRADIGKRALEMLSQKADSSQG